MEPARDPVPTASKEVLDLFRGKLSGVRFPDLDLSVLEDSERELLAAQVALEEAEAALEAARAVLNERSHALSAKTQRALAYAKVFAEEDTELSETVASIASIRVRSAERRTSSGTTPALDGDERPNRRRRPRRTPGEEASLFESDDRAELSALSA